MAGVESGVGAPMGAGVRHDVAGAPAGRREAAASLPAPGEMLTEDQVRERFGVEGLGSIRVSRVSKTIVLVNRADVHAKSKSARDGEYVLFNGRHAPDSDGRARRDGLILANSGRDGYEVLYFVKDNGALAFVGRVECVSGMSTPGNGDGQGLGASFRLRLAGDARSARGPLPDASLGSAEMVEDAHSPARGLDTGGALLESLLLQASGGPPGRILDYLARSGRVDAGGGSMRWILAGRPAGGAAAGETAESVIETLDILADPDLAMQIREGEADIRAGRVVPWVKGRAQNMR